MKTVIIIEDGRVEVQIDDGKPVVVDERRAAELAYAASVLGKTAEPKLPAPAYVSPTIQEPNPVSETPVTDTPAAPNAPPSPTTETVSTRTLQKRECIICGADISRTHRLKKLCGQRECMLEQQRRSVRKSYHKLRGHTALEKRSCATCGDDISDLDSRRKVCNKPECKLAIKRRAARDYLARQRKTSPAQVDVPDKPVHWCKHCQAYTTHDSDHHPKPEPAHIDRLGVTPKFLPGHEKTPEEIESLRPKDVGFKPIVPTDRDIARLAPPPVFGQKKTSDFEDPWNCQACRDYEQICQLHKAMEADGKKPPAR